MSVGTLLMRMFSRNVLLLGYFFNRILTFISIIKCKILKKIMNKIKSRINYYSAEHILTPNMILKSAGSHFYRIGLSLFPFRSEKRKKLFNPYLITIIIFFSVSQTILSLLIPDDDN
jgi:hypothetical protein